MWMLALIFGQQTQETYRCNIFNSAARVTKVNSILLSQTGGYSATGLPGGYVNYWLICAPLSYHPKLAHGGSQFPCLPPE